MQLDLTAGVETQLPHIVMHYSGTVKDHMVLMGMG
jgi:hypothetical protein